MVDEICGNRFNAFRSDQPRRIILELWQSKDDSSRGSSTTVSVSHCGTGHVPRWRS